MRETYEVTVPLIRSKTPPRPVLTGKTIESAAEKVREWVKTLEPEFTELDSIRMTKFKLAKEDIELKYEIIRDKYKEGGN